MKQRKFYAVRKGRQPGIYEDWEACKTQVDGFAGAQYKSFSTREDAARYLVGQDSAAVTPGSKEQRRPPVSEPIPAGHVVIYADGACSGNPGRGGYDGAEAPAVDRAVEEADLAEVGENEVGFARHRRAGDRERRERGCERQ